MCAWQRIAEKVWKKKDTAGFRWEIRNISIFITATWKTLECLHPLQRATRRKLAWGQISICTVAQRKREKEEDKEKYRAESLKWEPLMYIYNADLVGNEWKQMLFSSLSKPAHVANHDRVKSDKNLISDTWNQKWWHNIIFWGVKSACKMKHIVTIQRYFQAACNVLTMNLHRDFCTLSKIFKLQPHHISTLQINNTV